MGKKIKKDDILNDIQNKINTCLEYQKNSPDPSAEDRLKILENDPCGDLTYYVNITLKDCVPEDSINLSDRLKHIENDKYLPLLSELDDCFEAGCIITVTLNENGSLSYDVQGCGSFSQISKLLIGKYFDDSCYLTTLRPKKPIFGDNYIKDDIDTLTETGKKSVVYAMGRFNCNSIKELLEAQFDVDKYDLYSYNIEKFHNVGYIDMTKITSLEQNVNQFFKSPGILNNVTLFTAKKRLPNYELKKAHVVYDLARFINLKLDEIKKCDEAQARKKYSKYSEGVFKDNITAKYDTYKACGGGSDWSDWPSAQGQFLTYKAVSSYDKEFKDLALNNGGYVNNLNAYEITSNFFSNVRMECVKESWKKETKLLKKKDIGDLIFINNPRGIAKGKATEIIKQYLIDPPSIIVKPYGSTKIQFDVTKKYDFTIDVKCSWFDSLSNQHYEKGGMLSDPSGNYERVKGFFNSTNRVSIKRDIVKLDGIEYMYTPVDVYIDQMDGRPYTDDVLHKENYEKIPMEHYYNKTFRRMFKICKFDERVIQATLIYHIIPKVVTIPIKFIQHSYWENRDPADEMIKKLKEEYENKYLRLTVDSIPYDPWEKLIDKFEQLYSKWNKLESDKKGEFEFPPIGEMDDNEQKNTICSNCKKSLGECTCEKLRLCTKCFPLDMNGSFDPEMNVDFNLFNAETYIFNTSNEGMSFSQIAREIYHSIYPKEPLGPIEEFVSFTDKAMTVLNLPYDLILRSYSYRIEGSVLNQMRRIDFERFKDEYAKSMLSSYNSLNKKFVKKIQVGLMNGILYIPKGFDVMFEYDIYTGEFLILGTTPEITATAATLAKCNSKNYEQSAINIMNMFTNKYIPESLKKFIVYPYMPSLDTLINGSDTNQSEYVKDFTEEFVYKVDSYDLLNLKMNPFGMAKIPLRFSIYEKHPIRCSYPRCKDPIFENKFNDGVCGLDDFFRTPLIINSNSFLLKKEMKKRVAFRKVNELKKMSQEFIKNSMNIKISACDVTKNLEIIKNMKDNALNDLYNFGSDYEDLLSFVPDDPLADNGHANVICVTAKNAKLKSIMYDYNEVFSHTINTILALKEDEFNFSEAKFNSIIGSLTVCSEVVNSYFHEIVNKSQNFNMCSIKFNEYIDENENYKLLNDGMIEKAKTELSKELEKEVKTRITNDNIMNNVNDLNLSESDSKQLSKLISANDVNGVKAFVEKNKELLKTKIKNASEEKKTNKEKSNNTKDTKDPKKEKNDQNLSAIIDKCTSLLELTDSISNLKKFMKSKDGKKKDSKIKSITDIIKKELDPKSIEKISFKSLLDPSNLKDFTSNAVSGLIEKTKDGSIFDDIKGGLDIFKKFSKNDKEKNKIDDIKKGFDGIKKGFDGLKNIFGTENELMLASNNEANEIKSNDSNNSNNSSNKNEEEGPLDWFKNPLDDWFDSSNEVLKNKFIEKTKDKINSASKNLSDVANNLINLKDNILESSKLTAKQCKQFGDITKNIISSIEGSDLDKIDKQNSKEAKEVISKGNKSDVSNDIIISMYQYIKHNCEDYEKITNDFIQFN